MLRRVAIKTRSPEDRQHTFQFLRTELAQCSQRSFQKSRATSPTPSPLSHRISAATNVHREVNTPNYAQVCQKRKSTKNVTHAKTQRIQIQPGDKADGPFSGTNSTLYEPEGALGLTFIT